MLEHQYHLKAEKYFAEIFHQTKYTYFSIFCRESYSQTEKPEIVTGPVDVHDMSDVIFL